MRELIDFVEYVQALGAAVDKHQQSKVTHKAGVIVVLALLAQMCGYTSAVKLPLRLEELFSYEVHMTSSQIQHHSPHSKN